MVILIVALVLDVAVAALAARYQRSAIGWFVLALLLSPFVGLVLLAMGPRQRVAVVERVEPERAPTSDEVGAAYREARTAMAQRPYRSSV